MYVYAPTLAPRKKTRRELVNLYNPRPACYIFPATSFGVRKPGIRLSALIRFDCLSESVRLGGAALVWPRELGYGTWEEDSIEQG